MISKVLPDENCEQWYDGCVVCPTSMLKDFRDGDVICNPDICDLDLRKQPYCVQDYPEQRRKARDDIKFCKNSKPQLCRKLCLPSEYPVCDGDEYCVSRVNTCCQFECQLREGFVPASLNEESSRSFSTYMFVVFGIIIALVLIVLKSKSFLNSQWQPTNSGYRRPNSR